MLKIIDNFDLEKLKDYGFEIKNNVAIKKFYKRYGSFTLEDDTLLVVEYRQLWLIENGAKESNERYFGNPQFDTIYDLIKDGIVEKVSNEDE